jgi:pimeloyl-ACP methyl ester carboxylesterase
MHTRLQHQTEARVAQRGFPVFGASAAITFGTWLRTGVDIGSVDAEDTCTGIGARPVLLIHGTADEEDLPDRTQDFYDRLLSDGVDVELRWCEDSGHRADAGMPVDVCPEAFGAWVRDFFSEALQ